MAVCFSVAFYCPWIGVRGTAFRVSEVDCREVVSHLFGGFEQGLACGLLIFIIYSGFPEWVEEGRRGVVIECDSESIVIFDVADGFLASDSDTFSVSFMGFSMLWLW